MAEPTLKYRMWQHATKWIWQVMDDRNYVLASGVSDNSREARVAAFSFCLDLQSNQSNP